MSHLYSGNKLQFVRALFSGEFGHWPCSLYKKLRICLQGPRAIPKKPADPDLYCFCIEKSSLKFCFSTSSLQKHVNKDKADSRGDQGSQSQRCCLFLQMLVSLTQERLWERGPAAQIQRDYFTLPWQFVLKAELSRKGDFQGVGWNQKKNMKNLKVMR